MTISILKALRSGIQGVDLIALLGKTGKLQMFFCLALSVALIL
jgi:hypothetical protein